MPAQYSNSIFFGPKGNSLLQFEFSQAKLSASPVSKSAASYPYPGTTPSVSANGATDAIVWAIEHKDPTDVLHAYSATTLEKELYNSNEAGKRDAFGNASHFGTPMIVHGKVYVGTVSNVTVFGLLK